MSERDEAKPQSRGVGAQVLRGGAVLLAAAVTGFLVLSEDARLLRLGLVAALWVALTGAFVAARLRNQLAEERDREFELRRRSESDLGREVAARRESEAETENEARRTHAEYTHKIRALQAELHSLREHLQQVPGHDASAERAVLRAESSRERQPTGRGGQGHDGSATEQGKGRELLATSAAEGSEQSTELLSPVSPDPAPQAGLGWSQQHLRMQQPQSPRPLQANSPSFQQPPERGPAGSGGGPNVPGAPHAHTSQAVPGDQTRQHATGFLGEFPDPSVPEPEKPSSPGQPEEFVSPGAQAPGAHAEGTSVTDLLNAYGSSEESQRRRRD